MRHLLQTIATTGLLQVANLASGVMIARLLQPTGRGEFEAVRLWPVTLAYVLLLGLNDAMIFRSASGREAPRDLFAAGSLAALVLSASGLLTGLTLLLPLAYAEYRPEVQAAAMLMLAIIPCHLFSLMHMELLRGQGRMGAWNLLRLSQAVTYPLLIIGFWLGGHGDLGGFTWAFLLSHLPAALIPTWVAAQAGWVSLRAPGATLRALIGYGLQSHVGAMVNLLNLQLDRMIMALTLDPTQLGLYAVAVTLAQATYTLAGSVAMVAWPRAAAAPDPAAKALVIGQYLRLALALMLMATAGLLVLAPWLLGLLFGAEFVVASDALRLLVVGSIPIVIREFFIMALKACEKPLWVGHGELITLAVNAGLLFWLVPAYGLLGAAVVYVLVRSVTATIFAVMAGRLLGVSPVALFVPRRADLELLRAGWRRLSSKGTG